jgi:hypothetical protein
VLALGEFAVCVHHPHPPTVLTLLIPRSCRQEPTSHGLQSQPLPRLELVLVLVLVLRLVLVVVAVVLLLPPLFAKTLRACEALVPPQAVPSSAQARRLVCAAHAFVGTLLRHLRHLPRLHLSCLPSQCLGRCHPLRPRLLPVQPLPQLLPLPLSQPRPQQQHP